MKPSNHLEAHYRDSLANKEKGLAPNPRSCLLNGDTFLTRSSRNGAVPQSVTWRWDWVELVAGLFFRITLITYFRSIHITKPSQMILTRRAAIHLGIMKHGLPFQMSNRLLCKCVECAQHSVHSNSAMSEQQLSQRLVFEEKRADRLLYDVLKLLQVAKLKPREHKLFEGNYQKHTVLANTLTNKSMWMYM